MKTLEDFVYESNQIEGIEREPGELQFAREVVTTQMFVNAGHPTVLDLETFVFTVQPGAVLRRQPGMDVRVGDYSPPPGGPGIEPALRALLEGIRQVEARHDCIEGGAYQTHLAYECLHPFTDGNGRSGRALWLWQMGGTAPLGFLHRFYYQTLAEGGR